MVKEFLRAHIALLPSLLLEGRVNLQVHQASNMTAVVMLTEQICVISLPCLHRQILSMARLHMLFQQLWETGQDGVSPKVDWPGTAF